MVRHKGEWSGVRSSGGHKGSGQGSGVVEGIRGVVRGQE